MLCKNNHAANYKNCLVYKDLQRNFFPTLRRKVIASKPQSRIEPASIQTKLVQPEKSYASQEVTITRIDSHKDWK